ncbi:MAG: hypothetical protein WBD22_01225 [Pyrinomonadaceae bacterium]
MKRMISRMWTGTDTRLNGIMALILVGLIALGCTCGKDFDLANLAKNIEKETKSTPSDIAEKETPEEVDSADASTGDVPSEAQSEALARRTVLDFNEAIKNRDFSDFHSTVSKPFQKEATPERFESVFKDFIDTNPDLSDVSTLPAIFAAEPAIQRELGFKTLKLLGKFETSPRPAQFLLKYIPEGKDWKLISIQISTKDTTLR